MLKNKFILKNKNKRENVFFIRTVIVVILYQQISYFQQQSADLCHIEIILKQRCAKFIWSSLNITNTIIKTIALSAISSVSSTFGANYRYLCFKYNIGYHIWFSSLNEVTKCISLYISIHEHAIFFKW